MNIDYIEPFQDLNIFLDALNDVLDLLIYHFFSVSFKITIKDNTLFFTYWHFLLASMVITLLAKLIYNDWGHDD